MSSSSPELTIKLFGQVEVVDACGVSVVLPSRRAGWLISVLALAEGNPVERRYLAAMLWPDSTDAGALHNLRQSLALLRRALGSAGDCIAAAPSRSIYLDRSPRISVDVWEYDREAVERTPDALERALAHYRAPLLTECDEPFAMTAREVRERLYVDVSERLADHYSSQGNLSKAIDVLKRASTIDPYRESIDRSLMQALVAKGEAAAAIEIFRALRRRLRLDLGSDPDPETVDVFKSIKARVKARAAPSRMPTVRIRRLPTPISDLVGREAEVLEVGALLERCRLVTLAGVGGVGKTRLAIAVADSIEDRYLDGVRFVDLSLISDGASIPFAISKTLDFEAKIGHEGINAIADHLANRELLLVLDNCEHLIEPVSQIIEALLTASPRLFILATSRQSVGVIGELVWRVPSLPTPDPSLTADPALFPSVSLFLERCGRANLSDAELATVGSICRRLDGIPLAIELAASRARVLSVVQVEARLENQFALLAGGTQALARHRTLRATIEWSWELLGDEERLMMKRLSVFRGGCTMEAAEAIQAKDSTQSDALDLVSSLVDRSLIFTSQSRFGSRFSMLESIRQFTWEQIVGTEEVNALHRAHRDYFLNLAEGTKRKLTGADQTESFQMLELEHDNMRAALVWSHASGEHELGLRMAVALARFWDTHGHLDEGRLLLESSMEQGETIANPQLWADARVHAGWMATVQVDCVAARNHYEKALPYFREIEDTASIAKILNCLGTAIGYSGDFDRAQSSYQEALSIYEALEMRAQVATLLNNLGDLSLCRNDLEAARVYLERSLHVDRGLVNRGIENRGLTLGNLSVLEFRVGNYERARVNAFGSLRLFAECDAVVLVPDGLYQLAIVTTKFDDWTRVAILVGAADALAPRYAVQVSNLIMEERLTAIEETRAALGIDFYETSYGRGQGMSLSESISFALE